MCGILSVIPLRNTEKIDKSALEAACRFFATELLFRSEDRGKDASGLGALFPTGDWAVLKQPVASSDFVLNVGQSKYEEQDRLANYQSFMKSWRNCSEKLGGHPIILGHSRKGTRGNKHEPENNHPIIVENIVGVHNGTLENDKEIFELHPERKREGGVDSEAIFHLQHALGGDEEPSLKLMKEMDKRLYGAYTTMSVNSNFPRIVVGLRKTRPLEICVLNGLNIVLVASERGFINSSVNAYNRMIISLTGSRLPLVTSIDWKTIPDREAFILRADTDSLDECLEHTTLPFQDAHKLDEYKHSYTNNYTNRQNYSSSSNKSVYTPKKPSEKAKITNLTSYIAPKSVTAEVEEEEEYEGNGITVEGTVIEDDDDVISMDAEEMLFNELEMEGMETLQSMLEDSFDDTLFIKNIREDNALEKLCVQKSDGLKVSALLDTSTSVYKHAFPEGYVYGALKTRERLTQVVSDTKELEKKNMKLETASKRTASLIANLKTALMAAMVKGGLVDFSEDQMVIDTALFEGARELKSNFRESGLMSLFRSAKDIERMQELLYKEEVDDETNEDEDTA